MMAWVLAGVSVLLAAIAAAPASARVTDQMLRDALSDANSVLSWGITLNGQRYSALAQIDASNVTRLAPAWSFSFGGEKQLGEESQPLVYKGRIFVTASYSRVFAIDARTGRKLWTYAHRLPEDIKPCCDLTNRGAALYDDLVIFGTLDAQLVALKQDTGELAWKERIDDYKAGYSSTAAPIVADGLVLTGVAGGEFGVVGRVDARDARTGKLVWTRPVVEGHIGYTFDSDGTRHENGVTGGVNKTWPEELWKTGGAATWLGGTYDNGTGLAYFGTGSPAPWNSHVRPGDNLYASSTVAIDIKTGMMVWHYQNTPHDGWAYDGVNEFVTFDSNGRRLGAKADQNGFFYVNDAGTGALLNAFPFVKRITWASGVDLKTGRPNFIPGNRPGNPEKSPDGRRGNVVFAAPAFLGAKNQMPMAYSPKTGYFYVPANEWGMVLWNEPITYRKGATYLGAGFTIKTVNDSYIGAMRAIDPIAGRIVWEVKNGAPLWGGALTTGGRLVFYGTPEGFLKALDDASGRELWRFHTGTGVIAPPISFELDGEQYIVVVAGWGGAVPLWGGDVAKKFGQLERGGSVWAFKLKK